jgi:pilus assembly protein FimV
MGRETQSSPSGEQKLERYGVWVKVEPRTIAESQGAESSFELTDLETSGMAAVSSPSSAESTLTLEEEKLLDELDTELGTSESSKELSIPEEEPLLADDEELPDISEMTDAEATEQGELETVSEDELPELELEEEPAGAAGAEKGRQHAASDATEVEVTLSDTRAGQEQFEDLDALESELASVTASASKPQAPSSEILARIEDELRSIRADLTQLRGELSGMRKPGAEPAVAAAPAGSESQSGFFDEDEDETIALTGDELDNILNTAEITEEAAEAPAEEPADLAEGGEEGAPLAGPGEDVLELESVEIPAESTEETAVEELPAELDLEDLSAEMPSTPKPQGLPELDLEGIPEIEAAEEKAIEPAEEVGDLETLDLEEEVSDVETLEGPAASAGTPPEEGLTGELDLDALAAEAQELESDESVSPMEDLEIGELEAVAEEGPAAKNEIEIPFETEPDAHAGSEPLNLAEEVLEAEEVPAAEMAPVGGPAAKEGAAAIPEDLKDEIRTVLKYMDHLLEALPDEKIQEFAKSDYFVMYKKLFEDLGLGE